MDALLGKSVMAHTMPSSVGSASCENARLCPPHASISRGVQEEASSSSTSSRSIFTGPLKFLWFAKQKDPQTIELSDVGWEVGDEESSSSSGKGVDSGADDDQKKRSWVYTIWGLRSIIGDERQQLEEIHLCNEPTSSPVQGDTLHLLEEDDSATAPCSGCEMHVGDGCAVGSSIEVPHHRVDHTAETFSKFLHRLPLPELKTISRMSQLCNLAYMIPNIKSEDLLRHHGLRFVTSSLEKKAAALEQGAGPTVQQQEQQKRSESRFFLDPASAYAVASAVASYLQTQTKSLLQINGNSNSSSSSSESEKTDEAPPTVHEEQQAKDESEVASMIASSPMTAVVAAKEGTRDAMAKDLQSLHSCPCDWFCCDDRRNATRYFVIQGSESLASWQANLLFEPTHLEDTSLGVLVHRGTYEAAKGLYEQLLPQIVEHIEEHGDAARLCFTGHSLGGSLATLVALMLVIRGVAKRSQLQPVLTFGSPFVLCGGDFLLRNLGLPQNHVRSVMLHRDIVPRAFACDYPDNIAQVLKRLNSSFRHHPCLNNQGLLYAPMGEFILLQPSEEEAPSHPLLPQGRGLYAMRCGESYKADATADQFDHSSSSSNAGGDMRKQVELRAAQRAFLNSPHPLDILSDRGAYGSEGTISRDHDPRSYMRAATAVAKDELRRSRRRRREQRRMLWWSAPPSSQQLLLLIFAISAKGAMLTQGLAAAFAWC